MAMHVMVGIYGVLWVHWDTGPWWGTDMRRWEAQMALWARIGCAVHQNAQQNNVAKQEMLMGEVLTGGHTGHK